MDRMTSSACDGARCGCRTDAERRAHASSAARDEFLKGLRWESQEGVEGDRVLIVTGETFARPHAVHYRVTLEDQTTLRNLEHWLADRVAYMQERMLHLAGLDAQTEEDGWREYIEERGR